ncbi:MAG: hypothetical protein ABJD24_02130 [Acidimicrobiales bacterium]
MSSVSVTIPSPQVTIGRRAIKLAALLAAGAAVFGVTLLVREAITTTHAGAPTANTSGHVAMPKSAELEQKWGIQINSVNLLAATGVIDVRYTVFDVSKALALHTNGRLGLPKIVTAHGTVQPDSVMFHFHSKATEEAGQGYDIVYGNAEGRARVGDKVTIVMPDGLKLAGVPVGE